MILGIDAGMSAVKIVVLDQGQCVLTQYEKNRGGSMETLNRAMMNSGAWNMPIGAVAVTGINAANCGMETSGLPLYGVSEIDALGAGACRLAGLEKALVVNLGTGSTFVEAENGKYTHVGGTGLGGGAVRGLGRRMLDLSGTEAVAALALEGDLHKVDICIGDLMEGTDTLPAGMTASNLAKYEPDATDADWAAGILNLVLQGVGTMAQLICDLKGISDAVVVGGLAHLQITKNVFDGFNRLYKPNFHSVENSLYATALGAATILWQEQGEPQREWSI